MEGEREEPGESTESGTTSSQDETLSPDYNEESDESNLQCEPKEDEQADSGGQNEEAELSQEVEEDQNNSVKASEDAVMVTDAEESADCLPVPPLPTEEELIPPTEPSHLSHTQSRAPDPCFYCMRSLDAGVRPETTKQEDSEPSSPLPSSGQKLSYQTDPRPHFGVAWSSHSTCRPLWGSEGPCWGQRHQDMPDQTDTCPHCHLGLPPDTLRWHEAKCLLFEGLRSSKK